MSINGNEREFLFNEITSLLDNYDYKYTNNAIYKIIDRWSTQKADLIEAFKKHPNYLEGKFMIAFDCDYERKIDNRESYEFSRWLYLNAMPHAEQLPQEIKERMLPGEIYLPDALFWFLDNLNVYAERCISESTAEYLNDCIPEIHPHAGQKTSRVVNKICTYLGYDKVDGYNREFAKYADSLSPLTIKRHTVLSINPLDYLTMSFGNSWSSCHTIDKTNKRNMPNGYQGMYSSGTISYMLDSTSMVLYTVDSSYEGDEYWTQPKINRQMFHWGEEKLIQSRLYPQDNDYNGNAYTPYRNIVQEIISTIFDFPNLWTINRGCDNVRGYVWSEGTHYCDYINFDSVTLSRIKGSENANKITIGADPICIDCGSTHNMEANISCCVHEYCCTDCGEILDEDEVYWVDDEPYCRECVNYCEYCEEYHRLEEYYIDRDRIWVCEACLDEHYVHCWECDEYVHEDEATYIEDEDIYVCPDCLREDFTKCKKSGNYVRNEDVVWIDEKPYCEECAEECKKNLVC